MYEYSLDLEDLPNEIWKEIEGYRGLYMVSNMGRIKSIKDKHSIRKGSLHGDWYKSIQLCRCGEKEQIKWHRVVAKAFIPNPENKPYVNHINCDKTDNRVCNLEWVTAKENTKHGFDNNRMKPSAPTMNEEKHIQLIEMYATGEYTQEQLSKIFNLSVRNISRHINRDKHKK